MWFYIDAWINLFGFVARFHVCSLDLLVVGWYAPSAAWVIPMFCGVSIFGVGVVLLFGDGRCPICDISWLY